MKNLLQAILLTVVTAHQVLFPSIHENYTPSVYDRSEALSKAEIRSISPLQHLKMALYKATGIKKLSENQTNNIYGENFKNYHPLTATNSDNIQQYHDLIFDHTTEKVSALDHIKNAVKSFKYRYWTPRFNKDEYDEINNQEHQKTNDNFDLNMPEIYTILKEYNTLFNNQITAKNFNEYQQEKLNTLLKTIDTSDYTNQDKLLIFQFIKNNFDTSSLQKNILKPVSDDTEEYPVNTNKNKFQEILKSIQYQIIKLQLEENPKALLASDNTDIQFYVSMISSEQDFDNINSFIMKTNRTENLQPEQKIKLLQSFFQAIEHKTFENKQESVKKEFLTGICLDICNIQLDHNLSANIETNISNFYKYFDWDNERMVQNFIEFFHEMNMNASEVKNQIFKALHTFFPSEQLKTLHDFQSILTQNIETFKNKNPKDLDKIELIKKLARKTKQLIKFLQPSKKISKKI